MIGQVLKISIGARSIVYQKFSVRPLFITLALTTTLLAGCSGTPEFLSRDAEWFSKPGRVFIKNISIETPPLTPDKPITPDDLISADGRCPGMAPAPGDPNAPQDGQVAPLSQGGTVALGHTECDVARGLGAPDHVSLSTNERGDRSTVLTYNRGPRPGIYAFTAGRLTSIERVQEAAPERRPARGKRRSAQSG
ncbi:hypothetical protein BJ123_11214 [Rhodopseudomonas thermotolerans]|uniref:Uncharacterized protein n=2 Tax=Rhodopseudomonas TaxID=1073 RepID=A0A336JPF4_9BRAD|nr:hypothetical protein BJ125_11214 [Rhodopseudomonas pentothenatexigens]REF93547.1 hypothetical protein BJ123_11214 [Rhodopseudomonas thermotolerans]SSW91432.1 hypothetical protein SAMN05892882_11214 [Rhodopseudomonas pentothenatexigens]